MTNIALVPPIFASVEQYGAVCNGTTDDTSAINAALAAMSTAGGGTLYQTGNSAISGPITVPANCWYLGVGEQSGLTMLPTFSGAQMIDITGNYARVANMSLFTPTATYSSNPVADGIAMTGVTDIQLENLYIYNLNGWAVSSLGSASVGERRERFVNVYAHGCANGMSVVGVSGSSYVGSHELIGCNMDSVQLGDAYYFQDIHDIRVVNPLGECTAGTGYGIHLVGVSAAFFDNVDVGGYGGNDAAAVIRINDSVNNNAQLISIRGGIVEGGLVGIDVNSVGYGFLFDGLAIYHNQTHGITMEKASSGIIARCVFNLNGQTAGTHYEIQTSATGNWLITNNQFSTPQGAGVGAVTAVINDTVGVSTFLNNQMLGPGFTDSNFVATGGSPQFVRGYYPFTEGHNLTPPTITASPCTPGTQARDYMVYISGGTVSAIAIGSNVTGLTTTSTTGVLVFVPAQQSITITYSVAPTWVWLKA